MRNLATIGPTPHRKFPARSLRLFAMSCASVVLATGALATGAAGALPDWWPADRPEAFFAAMIAAASVLLGVPAEMLIARIRRRRQRARFLAAHVSDAIIATAPDGRCLFASPALEEISGYRPDEVIGGPVAIPIDDDDLARVREAYARMFAGEIDQATLAYRVLHRNGTWRWHESKVRLVRDEASGKPVEALASIRDITEHKAIEHDLHLAREEAEAATRAKSDFLAQMSHEIRTPMNGVLGFADLLGETELDEVQRKYLAAITASGTAMMDLLNDILDFAKISAGKIDIVPGPLDLAAKLAEWLSLFEAAAYRKGVTLTGMVSPDLPALVEADALRLRQILINLIGNAVKFTARGSVVVHAFRGRRNGEERLVIEVGDTGIGIPTDRLEAIFEEFSQADCQIDRTFGGTGLGLAISARLARLLGGEIAVKSVVDRGSTFTLSLPLVALAGPAAAAAADLAGEGELPSAAKRILVVEDHDLNQQLIVQMVRACGHEVALAADGAEAVTMVDASALRRKPFDMVLMDMQMPVLDGLSATRTIRANGHDARALPIVALTANCYADDIAACSEAGMQGHMAKPVTVAMLRATIDAYLGAAPGGPQETAFPAPPRLSATLTRRYRDRKTSLLRALANLAPDCADSAYDDLAGQLHKLAGSAGYFGDDHLGQRARELERQLREAKSRKARWTIVAREREQLLQAA
jgi:PAS domain S-box-containing protein